MPALQSIMEDVVTTATINYQLRPYTYEDDLQTIVAITNSCEAHDQLEEGSSIEELREEYGEPGFTPTEDVIIWSDSDQTPVGYAEYHAPYGEPSEIIDPGIFVWFKVVPEARDQGIEAQMFAIGEERRQRIIHEWDIPIKLRVVARDTETDRAALLTSLGFVPERYFLRMAQPLTGTLLPPTWPQGITVRAGDLSVPEYVALHNTIWVDHFGYEPWKPEDVEYYRTLNFYDPNLDLVAYAPDGQPAGFCWCSIHIEENKRNQRNDGWIGVLGIRREYRSIGLGRALLREGMLRLRAKGADFVRLGVDGASPTGATKLYASEGFETIYSRTLYARSEPIT